MVPLSAIQKEIFKHVNDPLVDLTQIKDNTLDEVSVLESSLQSQISKFGIAYPRNTDLNRIEVKG